MGDDQKQPEVQIKQKSSKKDNKDNLSSILKELPQVDEVLNHDTFSFLSHALPHESLKNSIRDVLESIRNDVKSGKITDKKQIPPLSEIATDSCKHALQLVKPSLRKVINASGVIIHTNLGRSCLCEDAVKAVEDVAGGYCTLEYSTENMARGSRHSHVEQLLCTLTGAGGAIAVNNNAAAVMMVLNEFAKGHEAIVSRGELVEIGGSFRVPDIMALSDAKMVEVGTTNKTHAEDYSDKITPDTAMLLKVHPSNYRMEGFVEDVSIKELRKIADAENKRRKKSDEGQQIIVYEDQGSGVLIEDELFKTNGEHTITDSLKLGVDIVSCSGDKLLGGPQAGIILGKKEHIDRLKKNPLARALRLDKMTLAALEATLRIYLDADAARKKIPTLRMLTESADSVKKRAIKLTKFLTSELGDFPVEIETVEEISRAGGGSLPMCDIATFCTKITFKNDDGYSADKFLVQENEIPIISRLSKECLYFDARTLSETNFKEISKALKKYFTEAK